MKILMFKFFPSAATFHLLRSNILATISNVHTSVYLLSSG